MTFRCLDNNKVIREVSWIYLKNAWVPVVTVCTYQLYHKSSNRILNEIIPDVNNLNLSLQNLGLNISWGSNSNYDTEISYNRNNTDWEIIIIEGNETMVDLNPGDTLQVRARFTDGNGNYSAEYTTASITVWNMADFTLYGLTESVNNNSTEANTVYSISINEEYYAKKIKTFTPENVFESYHKMFFFNGLIYRLIYKNRNGYQGYEFESLDPVTLEITPISSFLNEFNCTVQAMCFDQNTQYAYISTQCGFYRLELNGVLTQLSSDNNNIKAMDFYQSQLLALVDNGGNGPVDCYVTDPSNGTINAEPLFNLTVDTYSFSQAHSLVVHNGVLYTVVWGSSESYNGLFLVEIAINETTDITMIAQLPNYNRILGSININEEPLLVIQQDDSDFSGLYYYDLDNQQLGDLIIDTKVCCNDEGYQTVAFNPVDRHIYHACMRVRDYIGEDDYDDIDELIFEKLNPDTLEVTVIETSGLNYVRGVEFSTTSYINDGGYDMYDDGNFLSTNIQDNGFIEYTHTQQSDEGSDYIFEQIADGTVEDGTNWFGNGSTYFTNMYEGLFVMVAKDINITEFTISGNLGADGNGFVAQETITLNNGHTGYFKKVYGADDPSVNHLVIIPSKNGVTSNISGDTNDDYHSLENLSGVNYIYYLLFSTTEDNNYEITTEEARTIGNSFLSTITGSGMTASNILSRLNSGHANITQNIPDIYLFSDHSSGEESEFIGYKPGLNEPHCMTYQAGNKFLVASDGGLFSITTDGFISLVSSQFYWQECRGLAFVGNRLFASFSSIDQIAEVDPYTGEILNQEEDKKGPAVIVDAGENQFSTYGIRALAGNDEGLFISSYDDNEGIHTIAFISNLEPDENNILYATSITNMRFTGGLTVEKFGKTPPPGNWFWGYNEEFTGIRVPAYDNEEPIELNANELQVQWHEDGSADQSYTGWNDIEVQEVIQDNEGGDFIVVIDKPVDGFKIRMRFNNPVSKWSYYEWD